MLKDRAELGKSLVEVVAFRKASLGGFGSGF